MFNQKKNFHFHCPTQIRPNVVPDAQNPHNNIPNPDAHNNSIPNPDAHNNNNDHHRPFAFGVCPLCALAPSDCPHCWLAVATWVCICGTIARAGIINS